MHSILSVSAVSDLLTTAYVCAHFNSKAEGVDYLSDAQYVARMYPGPTTYKVDPNKVKPRVLAVRIDPDTKGKKSWKPVKSKEPDCASYEVGKGKDFVGRSQFIHKFAQPKGAEGGSKTSKETYTTIISRQKKFVPGVGSYTPKIDYVAVPYSRKRL